MNIRYSLPAKLLAAGLVLPLLALAGCGPSAKGARERPIPTADATSVPDVPSTSMGVSKTAPPTDQEVQEAVRRVFGDDLLVDAHPGPRFLAGDFNGDASPDILVAVKPVKEKLSEINSDVANWIIQDPQHAYLPPRHQRIVVPPPVPKPEKVRAGETLLAVIHGYGSEGWRDPMARQTYLLREAAGTALRISQPSKKLIRDFGMFPSSRDVVSENLRGSTGVLYWTGSAYAWHPER